MIRLFKVSIPSSVLALVVSEGVLIFSCYVLAAYWFLGIAVDVFLLDGGGLWQIALVAAMIMAGLYFNDLYENYRVRSRILLMQQFCLVLGSAFLLQALLNLGSWNVVLLPKWMMLYGSAMILVVLPLWRIFYTNALRKALGSRRLLFLGSSPVARQVVLRMLEQPELGLAPIGYLDSDRSAPGDLSGTPRLGTIADLDEVVATEHPDGIVVSSRARAHDLSAERLLDLSSFGIRVEDAAMAYEAIFRRVSTRDLQPAQLIFSTELSPRRTAVAFQSVYSVVLGLIAAIVALPVMAVVALLVRLSSPGPVLLREKRVGWRGDGFTSVKFRSAPDHWIRRFGLDELPQLFSVVRGRMSIVGPRAERPEFVALLEDNIPYYRQRHCLKPGITGWAQINQQYGDTLEELEYDLYYVKNLGWSLDIYIMLHALKGALLGRANRPSTQG